MKNKIIAEKSVESVRKHFENMGFKVYANSDVCANGVDMFISKNESIFSVEIKTVRNNGKKGLSTTKCFNTNVDYIAMAYEESVIVQPMEDHIKLCGKLGTRGITKLFKLIYLK